MYSNIGGHGNSGAPGGYSRYPPPGGYGPPNQPSEYIRPEVQELFESIDYDHHNYITYEQLQMAFVDDNDKEFNETACKMIFDMFDLDGNGVIDIYEFQQIYDFMNKWESIFHKYDHDKSNTLNKKELAKALKHVMGYEFSRKFIDSLFRIVDCEGKEEVDADEFLVLFVQMERLTNAFQARDTLQKGEIAMSYDDFMMTALKALF